MCVCVRERGHIYVKENTVMIIAIIHYNSVRYRRNGYMIIIYACMCVCVVVHV